MSLTTILNRITYPSKKFSFSDDIVKKIVILVIMSYFLISICFFLGIDSILNEISPLGYVLIFVSLSAIASNIYFRYSGNFNVYTIALHIIFGLLCVYLVYSGGRENTGPLWSFVAPVLSFYLVGYKKASIICIVLIAISAAILLIPGFPFSTIAPYPAFFKARFLISISIVTFTAYLLEYSRYHTQLEIVILSQELDRMSRTDELTGLSNRRDMYEWLKQESYRYERNRNPFSITLCDIDHFKNINDVFGHDCGDFILKNVARLLTESVRKQDKIARWGGEEFLILHPETNLSNAGLIAERMRKTIEKASFSYQQCDLHLTLSFGTAMKGENSTIEEVIKNADENLYHAKRAGRNRVVSGNRHEPLSTPDEVSS
jgi:diguanylate cyclase (GGDEF)-like protein